MNGQNKLDPRVERTRSFLKKALFDLILEKGYEEITIFEITEKAGLNRATFYLHYKNKYDLLSKSMQAVYDEINKRISEFDIRLISPDEPSPSTIQLYEHIAKFDQFYLVMINEKTGSEFINYIKDALIQTGRNRLDEYTKAIQVSLFDQQLIELAINYAAGAIIGMFSWWLRNQKPFSTHEMALHTQKFLMQGIFKPMGIDNFNK